MKSYSQNKQDILVYEKFFKSTPNGFFIEIGADDGVHNSNTLLFEKLGWKGICIEPSPRRYKSLQKNRGCWTENVAISNKSGSVDFLDIIGYGKGLSGIIAKYNNEHQLRIEDETSANPLTESKSVIKVKTVPFEEIASKYKITEIDYCSIDVEGGEMDILSSIDFEKIFIKTLTVEDNYNNPELRELVCRNGFIVYGKIGADILFCNKKILSRSFILKRNAKQIFKRALKTLKLKNY